MLAGSVFGGVGGFELGLAWAGIRTAWSIEIDVHRRRVLKAHFPHTRVYSDIKWVDIDNDLGYVDVICGGFPCRDTSNAGLRAGLNGKQSGLFFDFLALVARLRPRWVIIENVSGLLANGMGTVITELAALGYMGEWESIPARCFGAPHWRDRVWIVARLDTTEVANHDAVAVQQTRDLADPSSLAHGRDVPAGELPPPVWAVDSPSNGGSYLPDSVAVPDLYDDLDRIFAPLPLAAFAALCQPAWRTEPRVARVADGLPDRVDGAINARNAALGDSLIPYIPCYIAIRMLNFDPT